MPQLSCFTPCGMLDLSSEPSHAEKIYQALVRALSKSFDMTVGTRQEAWAYATAMMLGRAQYALDRAGNQGHPLEACDLLPLLEQAYLVVPSPAAGLSDRAATLAAIDALSGGGRISDLASGLRALLGASLLAIVRTSDLTAPTVFPASPGLGGGNFVDLHTPGLWLRLVDPVATLNVDSWVAYEYLDTSHIVTEAWQGSSAYAQNAEAIPTAGNGYFYLCSTPGTSGATEPVWPTALGQTVADGTAVWTCAATVAPLLQVGQTLTVQGENTATLERVTVEAVSTTPPAGSMASAGPCFKAYFTKPHDVGASVVTGPFPYWWSTQRQLLVVLSAGSSLDRETRRKVDDFMRRAARGVDTWAILAPVTTTPTGGTVGGVSAPYPMGTSPFGTYTFVNTT